MKRQDFETTRAIARHVATPRTADERPYLLGIAGEHAGAFFPLEGLNGVTVGRTEDCEIACTLDTIVSRRHCRIEAGPDGEFRVVDLASTNGTLVNGRDVPGALLKRGDRIFIGQATIFKFDYLSDAERDQWQSASVDPLTDCFNRAFFDSKIGHLFELARASQRPLSLIMVDADHFKRVNDDHGHQGGDHALHEIAASMYGHLDAKKIESFACRYGGEEFVVLAPGCDAAGCAELAEGLRASVASSAYEFEGQPLTLTVSVGGATLDPARHENPDQLVKEADMNLYRAKKEGRNRAIT